MITALLYAADAPDCLVLGCQPHNSSMRTLCAVFAVLLGSCVTGSPSASPSANIATPNPSAVRAALDGRFGTLRPGPAYPGSVWSVDQPLTLEPRAFGTFPADRQPGPVLTFDRVRLATTLPSAPDAGSVALVGSYDETWKAAVSRTVADPTVWDIVPLFASLSSNASLGPMPAGLDAARAILRRNGLLPPDMEPHPYAIADRFEFIRRLDGLPIFTNNGVSLHRLADGGTQALARRRPILAVSRYALRTPSDAWALLQVGQAHTMYVDDGAPVGPVHLSDFAVTSIELVYLELQVTGPHELLQPYYAFRELGGSILYVPAVAF
ncbi:MAG: hypothetical protein M3Z65_01555 [Chloroflexota bacterium]|nr:hypothetical protein [Chloroflexota bacterium]